MKFAWLMILMLLVSDPVKIGKINSAKKAAKDAFQSGDYQTAIEQYKYLIDSLEVNEEEVLLNLAHAEYLLKDTANAFNNYQLLTQSSKNEIASKANLQLGLMTNQKGKPEEALSYFKQALKKNPSNEDARYNYEMLKKKLDEQKKKEQQQNKDQQNKDQEKKDQQNKEQNKDQQNKDQQQKDQEKKDQENKENQDKKNKDQQQKDQQQKEKEQKEDKEQQEKQQQEKDQQEQKKRDMQNLDREKLEQMKISEEKAQMILEAMRNQEKQYLQQNKRKATKSKDRTKPDW
jgi:Ca-activated chloride channel homolog